MTLARILDLNPKVKCFHEPRPRLIIESKRAYEGSPCSGEVFAACRIDLVSEILNRGLIYGECANGSTFFAPYIDRFFNRKVKFIHLVRELEGFVQSGLKRHWYKGNPWDVGRIVPKEGWSRQSQRGKIIWLWHETNAWIKRFLKTVDASRRFHLDFSDLVSGNMKIVGEMFSYIGVDTPNKQKVLQILEKRLNSSDKTLITPTRKRQISNERMR
jgi:hypothetical protein